MKTRIAVVGVGHLGRHHARLLRELDCELVAVADPDERARAAAEQAYGVPALADYRELARQGRRGDRGRADQAAPRRRRVFLEHGVDVLVEKPIARTSAEGRELVDLARRHGRILQVGHVERFNVVLQGIAEIGKKARYIESHRLAPFSFRSTDIGVVLDLMIHDLDLVLALVDSEIVSVDAFGGAVFTPAEDMASAIIKFENGAVAHLTANRVALKPMRKMRVFSPEGYASLDFQSAQGMVVRKNAGWDLQKLDLDKIDRTQVGDLWKFVFDGLLRLDQYLKLDEGNPLKAELAAFLTAVQQRSAPVVSGEDGVRAVAAAEKVVAAIAQNRWE
ncbi:MAG: Gfo/Idh/MocA family oxidoreductase [Planctomycetes bacterium]|nr:Gfo/Idh/MocA family oxidoreductase [Planctomycetota bacterium]